MAFSLGLTLYNLKAREAADDGGVYPPRPQGPLVWLHAPGQDSLMQICGLARRLEDEGGVRVLLTTSVEPPPQSDLLWIRPPDETPGAARAFLGHWQPDAAGFAEGELRPALMHEAHVAGVPMALLDARAPFILKEREGWWPGLMRGLLAQFRAIHAVDETSARALRRAGAATQAVEVCGRMEFPSAALPCTEAERAELAQLLVTRPVWFAAGLPETEEAQVIEAHRTALKLAHRLLLIVSPQHQTRGEVLSARMKQAEGWTVARRVLEEEPDPEVQVYVTDANAEFGLWYRLAPITYLAGSLSAKGAVRDPMEAAALGSAIVHGPKSGRFGAALGRLAAAQATCLVGSAANLAEALGELLAPDQAALLAQAAWAVASDGAEATEKAMATLLRFVREGA